MDLDFSAKFDCATDADVRLELRTCMPAHAHGAQSPHAGTTLLLHALFLTSASPYFEAHLRREWYQPPAASPADPSSCQPPPHPALTGTVVRALKAALPHGGKGQWQKLPTECPDEELPSAAYAAAADAAPGMRVLVEHVEEEELHAAREALRSIYHSPTKVMAEAAAAAGGSAAALLLRMLHVGSRFQLQGCIDACFAALGALVPAAFSDVASIGLLYGLPEALAATGAHRDALARAKATAVKQLGGMFGAMPWVGPGEREAFGPLPLDAVLDWVRSFRKQRAGADVKVPENVVVLAAAWASGERGLQCSAAELRRLQHSLGPQAIELAAADDSSASDPETGSLLLFSRPKPRSAGASRVAGAWMRAVAWLRPRWQPILGGTALALVFAAELLWGRGLACRSLPGGGPAALCGARLGAGQTLLFIGACLLAFPFVLVAVALVAGATAVAAVLLAWGAVTVPIAALGLLYLILLAALALIGTAVGQGNKLAAAAVPELLCNDECIVVCRLVAFCSLGAVWDVAALLYACSPGGMNMC